MADINENSTVKEMIESIESKIDYHMMKTKTADNIKDKEQNRIKTNELRSLSIAIHSFVFSKK